MGVRAHNLNFYVLVTLPCPHFRTERYSNWQDTLTRVVQGFDSPVEIEPQYGHVNPQGVVGVRVLSSSQNEIIV